MVRSICFKVKAIVRILMNKLLPLLASICLCRPARFSIMRTRLIFQPITKFIVGARLTPSVERSITLHGSKRGKRKRIHLIVKPAPSDYDPKHVSVTVFGCER